MKNVRISLAAIVAIFCFAFTTSSKPSQAPCNLNLRWFAVNGSFTGLSTAIANLFPVSTIFGDVTPNEVPTGTQASILLSTFSDCAIEEDYFCALGYVDAQLEVKLINGSYYWVPKANETPRCVIKRMQ